MRENNEKQMEIYKYDLMKRLDEKEGNLERVQKQKEHRMMEKHNDDIMKMTDKRENVERIMKVQQYERNKLMNKIDDKMFKADHIKAEREQLLQQRQVMKKEIEKQKRDMMEKLDKVKQGKLDPVELLKSISKETPQNIGILSVDHHKPNSSVPDNSRVAAVTRRVPPGRGMSARPRRLSRVSRRPNSRSRRT